MKFKVSDVICINVKGHNEEQLFAISKVYVIDFDFLKELKSKYDRIWIVQEKISEGVDTYLVAAKNSKKYLYFKAGFTSEELDKVVLVKPINTPKVPAYLKKDTEKKVKVKAKIDFDVDMILDKISESGMDSLTKEELEFLKKV